MKIKFISVGKTSFDYLQEGIEVYLKRLKHYVKLEYLELPYPKLNKTADEKAIKKAEGELILKHVANGDSLVLFDENGNQFSSTGFADFLQKKMNAGTSTLIFVIGGAYGFSPEIYQRANQKISLSKMTFSHQMVRLFAIEQIYRGFTILKGQPYHHS